MLVIDTKNLLIVIAILVAITLENLILSRKKTLVCILFDQLFFTWIGYLVLKKNNMIFWKISPVHIWLLFSVTFLLFLLWIKYRNHVNDGSDLDYSDRIYSVSAVFNKLHKPKEMVVGRILPVNHNEIKYNMKALEIDNVVLSGATLITGSTGSGKTSTMKTLLLQRILEGKPVVFFDYKGEEDILNDIKGFAESVGLPYYEFSSRDCNFTYDPFINLNETGKVEALMNTRRWSMDGADEHYKTSMQLAIQNLVRSYDEYRTEKAETSNYLVGLYNFAQNYRPQSNERDGFNNLIKSLEILLSSRANQLLRDNPSFTFETDEPYVICFSFTSANKALANQISSFVYTDIMDRGTRRHYKDKLLLCVDEFGTLESSTVIKDLLEKARSGGVQTIFSILDINQISMTSGEFFTKSILGVINNYIIHAGATQSTAEMLASVQKYDKDYDIMSLRKPYKGKKPTALFITKYNILSKKNNQDVYRMIPYSEILKKSRRKHFEIVESLEDNKEEQVVPMEEEVVEETLDLSQPLTQDTIDKYL